MSDYIFAIIYNVWINGMKLDTNKKQCIQSIDIIETDDGADSATITISDPEFLYIEDNIFLEDSKIKVEFGWDMSTYRSSFQGYISAIDINFGSDGIPVLTLTCMDNTHRMNRKKKNNTYKNCTSAEIVRKIVTSYGYKCITDRDYKFTRKETYTQSNQTDIDFITKLAGDEVYPFTARLVGDTFYYVRIGKLKTPKMTLTYQKYPHEIISFNPKINKETKQVEIENSSITTTDKKVYTTTGKTNTKKGNSSTNSSNNKSNNRYTYNPNTKTWIKK